MNTESEDADSGPRDEYNSKQKVKTNQINEFENELVKESSSSPIKENDSKPQ